MSIFNFPDPDKRRLRPPAFFLKLLCGKLAVWSDNDVQVLWLACLTSAATTLCTGLIIGLMTKDGIEITSYQAMRSMSLYSAFLICLFVFPYIFLTSRHNIDPIKTNPQRLLLLNDPNKRVKFFRDLKWGIPFFAVLLFFAHGIYDFFLPSYYKNAVVSEVWLITFLGIAVTAISQILMVHLIVLFSLAYWQERMTKSRFY